jgi:hypothetical protein
MALPATSTVDKTCGYGCNEVTEIGDSVPGDVPVESMVPMVCRQSFEGVYRGRVYVRVFTGV